MPRFIDQEQSKALLGKRYDSKKPKNPGRFGQRSSGTSDKRQSGTSDKNQSRMSASGKRVHNENTLKQDSTPNVNKKRKLENSGNLKRKENPKKRKFGGLDERKSKRRKQCRIDTMFTPSSVNVSADESAEKISPVDKVTNDKATNVTDLNLQHKRKRVQTLQTRGGYSDERIYLQATRS